MKKIFIAVALTATLGVAHATDITLDSCRGNCSPSEGTTVVNRGGTAKQAQRQVQRQVANGGVGGTATVTGSGNSNSTINVDGSNANNASQTTNTVVDNRNPRNVSTAYAASIPPTAVCAGSTSGGIQGASFGVSVGSSWTDQNCMLLEQVRTVSVVLGQEIVAQEMMCAVDAYREARIRVGNPCAALPEGETTKTRLQGGPGFDQTDPIIRARLGLPPLKG